MRMLIAIALVLSASSSASAISRYQSTRMSCEAIHAAIDNEGAVILRYPGKSDPAATLYDRYVDNGGYCDSHQVTERVSVPAADTRRCRVLHCVSAPDDCEGLGSSARCRIFVEPRRMRK